MPPRSPDDPYSAALSAAVVSDSYSPIGFFVSAGGEITFPQFLKYEFDVLSAASVGPFGAWVTSLTPSNFIVSPSPGGIVTVLAQSYAKSFAPHLIGLEYRTRRLTDNFISDDESVAWSGMLVHNTLSGNFPASMLSPLVTLSWPGGLGEPHQIEVRATIDGHIDGHRMSITALQFAAGT